MKSFLPVGAAFADVASKSVLLPEQTCGALQYYVTILDIDGQASGGKCAFQQITVMSLSILAATGLLALVYRFATARPGSREKQLLVGELADDDGYGCSLPTANQEQSRDASVWGSWVRFWHADFTPYTYGEANKMLFLTCLLALSLASEWTSNVPFGDSPLAAPDMAALTPPAFSTWSYPGSILTVASAQFFYQLYAVRTMMLVVWAACCGLLVVYPRAVVTKLSLAFVALTFFYYYGLVQCFVGQNHRFLVPAWSMLGLAISHCTGDDGSWLRKFVLLMMCYTYFAGGIAKQFNAGIAWWQGDVLEWYFTRFVSDAQETRRETFIAGMEFLLHHKILLTLASCGAMCFELFISAALLPIVANFRWIAYAIMLSFHFGIFVTMGIQYWPQCICLILVIDLWPGKMRSSFRPLHPAASGVRVLFTTFCVICMVAVISLRAEAWPFSNIPMYSVVHRANPETMRFDTLASFTEEAHIVASAPMQFGSGLGRSVIVNVTSQNKNISLRTLDQYRGLPSAGVNFKWYGYLTKAVALQEVSGQHGGANGPLADLFLHFGNWLAQDFDLCKDAVTITAEPYLSPRALKEDGQHVLATVKLPTVCHKVTVAASPPLVRAMGMHSEDLED